MMVWGLEDLPGAEDARSLFGGVLEDFASYLPVGGSLIRSWKDSVDSSADSSDNSYDVYGGLEGGFPDQDDSYYQGGGY